MKKYFCTLLIIFSLCVTAEETESTTMARNQIRAFLEETETLYTSEDPKELSEAATRFQALREQTPEGEMNPDALRLAEGMAQLKSGDPEEALRTFDEIDGFEDPVIRGQLRQMKGNAHLKMAQIAMGQTEWEDAKAGMEKAEEAFINTLRENPEMEAARNNLEFAQKCLREIEAQKPPPSEDKEDKQEDQKEEEKDKDKQEEQKQDPENQKDGDDKQKGQQDPSQDQQDPSKNDPSDSSDPSDPSDQKDPSEQDPSDQKDPSKQDPKDQKDSSKQDPSDQQEQNQAGTPGEMSDAEKLDAMQAQQLLDAALEQEKAQRRLILQGRARTIPVEKDW